jgi:hypothetical protein
VGFATGFGDAAVFLPDLKEELALLGCGEAKVRPFLAHTAILPDFRVLFKVQVTKTILRENPLG